MVAPGAKKPPSARQDGALRARHEALALVEEKFRDFDVVWAKVHGFPWWPGVLFHSWDVVRRAGIRTDPKIVAELVVPPPEKAPGRETGVSHLRRHCLVMFLDKFNFSVVEIEPGSVASFTAHYELYQRAVMGSKNKKKTEFRRALVKAAELLHLGNEYVEDDLVMLEEPSPAEKKQRMEEVMGVDEEEDGSASQEDAWDDLGNGDDAAPSAEEVDDLVAEQKKPARKSQKKKSGRRGKMADAKDVEDEENEEDVVLVTPAKQRRKAPAKDSKPRARKASRKEIQGAAHVVSRSSSPIDLTNSPESEKKKSHKDKASGKGSGKLPKPRKKKIDGDGAEKSGRSKVLIVDADDEFPIQSTELDGGSEQVPDEVADITKEEELSDLVLTPLSSIWTTTVAGDQSAGAGGHTQLAYKQSFVWDDAVFTDDLTIAEKEKTEIERKQAEDAATHAGPGRSLGKRQSRSVQQSQIRQNLMTGNLDPHTMVQCTAYRPKDYVEDPNSRSRGGPTLDPPFQVVVHPDAVFVADLHSHLATCEIIGFLGGKWDEASKTLYIQAAFPCRSLVIDGDDGSTDVEMDPGSEIELRGIIENAQLEVVGWYHSHPAFAPDPSVRDIENQSSYQQLFQRPATNKEVSGENKPLEPFVGLIVGTYDTRRNTPVSLFRYFHTRGEKVSGGSRREIYMPYELIPGRRHFRSVLQDEERERTQLIPMYRSVLKLFDLELTSVKQQLPVDIKVAPTRRTTSKSSPVRKRKPSSDNVGYKPVKKARAKNKPSTRSTPTGHIDLTGEEDAQNSEPVENGVAKREIKSAATNGDMAETTSDGVRLDEAEATGEAVALNDPAPNDEKVVEVPALSVSVEAQVRSIKSADEKPEDLEVGSVERQVAAIVTDAVLSFPEVANSGGEQRKRSRKGQHPKRISENSGSSGGGDQLSTDSPVSCDASAKSAANGSLAKIAQREGAGLNGVASGLAVKIDVDSVGAPLTSSTMQTSSNSSSSSVAKIGASPSTSSSSSRKRNRKPTKTIKNSNRSNSPASDGPSPGRSPSPIHPPAQAYIEVFQASGPRLPNGGTHEDSAQPLNRASCPKPDNLVDGDIQYIDVDESMDMGVPSHASESEEAKTTVTVNATKYDNLCNPEVRRFVTSLVDMVVERVAQGKSASGKLRSQDGKESLPPSAAPSSFSAVANGCSSTPGNSAFEATVNGFVEVKGNTGKSDSIAKTNVAAAAEDSNSSLNGRQRRTGPHLFGRNCEVEDIQTSLQKMAVHVDKLKTFWAANPSEADTDLPADAPSGAESKRIGANPKVKQGGVTGEQDHLTALRIKYGTGMGGCTEQVITLVDYYRDFERRTDLNEIWKSRITKLEKIETSLSEYVQLLNIPAALRYDFIKDLISYLRESWASKDRRR
ncbi:hypothetical protein PRIC2_001608 [Phytophthora ramorum]